MDATLEAACKGADLAVDLACEAPDTTASACTDALLRACASHGVPSIVQCSDALVGYDASADVCDGDELSDPGLSLISPDPRPAPPATGRLLALRHAEDALARHCGGSSSASALVLRLHRVYSAESVAAAVPAWVALLLASGLGLLGGGARAQTTLLHVEDAAYGVVLAADKLLLRRLPGGGAAAAGEASAPAAVDTIVLADPQVWAAHHLITASFARVLHLPPPLLPIALPVARLLAALTARVGLLAAPPRALHLLDTHCYYTGAKAEEVLGFTPVAAARGVHAALAAAARAHLPLLRAAPLLKALACFLIADACHQRELAALSLMASVLALVLAARPAPRAMPPQPAVAPPLVAGGVPLLGHLLSFIEGPVGMIDALRSNYRSMFTIRVGPQRITFMIGAGPQLQFIKAKDELLDQAPVYGFTIPVFGKGIVYDSPLDERQQQVKLLVHSMNTKGLEAMVPKMIDEAEDYFYQWGDEGEVELRQVFSELIIMTASSCLMGPEIRENLSTEIARIYHSLDGGLTPLSTLWPSAPTQKHRERDEAREEMVGIFSKIIAARRAGKAADGGAAADDFLQKIIDFRYRDETDPKTGKTTKAGRGFTDSEVTGWLIVLLFAGQHTSSITATWLGAMLLQHPEAMAEVKREQEARCPDEESLNYANLLEMDAMRRSITETLRLYPPLILLMRKVMRRNFKVGQHTIPKGDVVGLCAPASNLDPRYWPDATAFRPSRYLPGEDAADRFDSRSVGHGLLQGFMLSFGGGAHMCSGRRFGYLQVSTIWTILLRDFDMEMVTPLPKPAYNDMVVGPDAPIMMRYKRKVPLAQAAASKAKARVEAREAAARLVAAAASGANGGAKAAPAAAAAGGGGVSLSSARPASAAFPRGPLVILWGSQTGTAEGFGNQLMREARMRGFDARSVDLEEYAPEKLADEDEAPVVFLMSTHGEGEPTDNARAFYRYFEDERCDNLKSLRYAAFALGNTQYQHFCAMGKWVDATCAKLGATRLCELGLGNDDDDLEGDFEAWREVLWAALCPDLLANGAAAVASGGGGGASAASPKLAPTLAAPPAQFDAEWLADDAKAPSSTLDFLSRCQPKHTLFECVVKANRELCAQPQYGSVRHVELAAAGDGAAAPCATTRPTTSPCAATTATRSPPRSPRASASRRTRGSPYRRARRRARARPRRCRRRAPSARRCATMRTYARR